MRRPPSEWFARCTSDVAAAGGRAVDPNAVCGATWQLKTMAAKRQAIENEEMMATKKKKKKKKHAKKRTTIQPHKAKKKKTHRKSAKHREMAQYLQKHFGD